METNKEIMEMVKLLGADTYKEGQEWRGYKVFIPQYKKVAYVGLPYVIFEDIDGYRFSTADEAIEYKNATTVLDEYGEPVEVDETTEQPKFTNFKNPNEN